MKKSRHLSGVCFFISMLRIFTGTALWLRRFFCRRFVRAAVLSGQLHCGS
jgi:hypothetical protein